MTTINRTRFDPGPNIHKNAGNKNASFSNEICQSVHDFVKEKGVNNLGKAGAQIPQLPLGDDSSPWGR
jgi:hypothetical protein